MEKRAAPAPEPVVGAPSPDRRPFTKLASGQDAPTTVLHAVRCRSAPVLGPAEAAPAHDQRGDRHPLHPLPWCLTERRSAYTGRVTRPVRTVAAAWCLVAASLAGAARSTTDVTLRNWGVADGLPQSSVNAIVHGSEGYLWVGTFGGLARFDGSQFYAIHAADGGLARILSLCEDSSGTLWAGTEGDGLWRVESGTLVPYPVDPRIDSSIVNAIARGPDDTLWIGTKPHGLFRIDGNTTEQLLPTETLQRSHVTALYQPAEPETELWVGTYQGLVHWDGASFEAISLPGVPDDGAISSVAGSPGGGLWVGTYHGLVHLGPPMTKLYTMADGLQSLWIQAFSASPDGSLWTGSDAGTIQRLHNGVLESRSPRADLGDTAITSLHHDRTGNLWVGTSTTGLWRVRDSAVQLYDIDAGLHSNQILAVTAGRDGTVYAGLNCGGVDQILNGRVTLHPVTAHLGNGCVWSLAIDRQEALWVGTWGGGITVYDDGRVTQIGRSDGLPSNAILALYEASDGAMWVGLRRDGLCTVRDGSLECLTFEPPERLSVRCFLEDDRGGMWIGTSSGVRHLAPGQPLAQWRPVAGLEGISARSLFRRSDRLWVGTHGDGLLLLAHEQVFRFRPEHGVFDRVVSWIGSDESDQLWLTGNRGIFRADPNQLEAIARGERRSTDVLWLGIDEGLRNAECNGGFQPAGWKDPDGHLWIPTLDGLATFDPSRFRTGGEPPSVRIERVVLDGQPGDVSSRLQVTPGRHRIEIAYSAVSLDSPERVRFRSRLVGYDEDWVDLGTERSATFTSLPPGSYRFEVIGHDASGAWSKAPATLQIEVPQPLWQSLWFNLGSAALLLTIISGFAVLTARRRVHRANERARLASEVATGLLHEARQPLQVVVSSLELAARLGDSNPAAAAHALERAGGGTQRLAELLEQVERLEQEGRLSSVTYAGNHRMILLGGGRDGTESPDR